MVAVRSKAQARLNIFRSQIGKIIKDFCDRHASGKIGQDIIDRVAESPNSWFAASDVRINGILNGKGFVPLSVYTLLQHSVMW